MARNQIEMRRTYAEQRLAALTKGVQGISALKELHSLCIYVTGSFGRLEASKFSDLDLFFIHQGKEQSNGLPKIQKTLLDAELIRLTEKMGFPPFSNDGEYLTIHFIDDIREALGSREDDFRNFFTARLLLLLESRCVHNGSLYSQLLEQTIDSYYKDYHDHERNFRPVFLINDIIRFWRTLCLNYEHRRNRRGSDEESRNKNHLMNLKLKFSRLMTCFASVLLLSRNRTVVTPKQLTTMIRVPPIDRLDQAAEQIDGAEELVRRVKDCYGWFLEKTARPKDEQLAWIAEEQHRNDAFDRGRRFAGDMYELIRKGTTEETMRYLVI